MHVGEGEEKKSGGGELEKISAGVIEKSCSAVSGVLDVRYTDIFFFFFHQTYFSQTVGGLFGMEGK